MISQSVMTYKQFCKEHLLLARLSVLRRRLVEHESVKEVASSFSMGRNSVTRLTHLFYRRVPPPLQEVFFSVSSLTQSQVEAFRPYLSGLSRRPHHHAKEATQAEEKQIETGFALYRVGAKQLLLLFRRTQTVGALTLGKIKGVYRRKNFKVRKIRCKKGPARPLYDYRALGVFEHLHYDTKELLDLKALPSELYAKLATMKEAPKYLWNIMDAKSRFRFIAFSRTRTSTMGWSFLVTVLTFLRHMGVTAEIKIGMDNGMEFCAGSARKEAAWNAQLLLLNASVYSYEPRFDVRKNLIERSHGTDDSHFLLPALSRCDTAEELFQEGKEYWEYFNWKRPHTGIEMHGRTPAEVITQSKLFPNPQRLCEFPILFLDHEWETLLALAESLRFATQLTYRTPLYPLSTKQRIDFIHQFPYLHKLYPSFAPNVLDQHRIQTLRMFMTAQ